MASSIETTFGALLLGGYCSAILAGVVVVQVILYIKLFPDDSTRTKAVVGTVCTLDGVHTILVCIVAWSYLITHYGDESSIGIISIPFAFTGLVTGLLTFIVHCFYSHRIYKLSRHRWQFTALIMFLALFRLCCASVSSAEMIRLKTVAAFFKGKFRPFFTLGLATSCAVDILITVYLTYTLKALQKEQNPSNSDRRVIGAVLMYTLETNMLTSAATMLTMIFWLTMSNNLIFIGIHFSVSKLYTNSLLATLNTRKQLQWHRYRGTSADSSALRRFPNIQRSSTGKIASRTVQSLAATKITSEMAVELGADETSSSHSFKHLPTLELQA